MFNIQTERNGAGYCYDGYDSNGQNVALQIKCQPIYTDWRKLLRYNPLEDDV